METTEFLERVITTKQSGQLLLAIRNHAIPWHEEFHQWPDEKGTVVNRVAKLREAHDIYFTPHLFSTAESTKQNVLPSRTIQADLDAAKEYPLEPTILVQTSPDRYQGYWVLKYEVDQEDLERLSKRLTYAIQDSDHSGWSLGHRVRVPGTLNFKYNTGPYDVSVIKTGGLEYVPEDIDLLPPIPSQILAIYDQDFNEELELDIGPYELINTYKDRLSPEVFFDYVNKAISEDRSSALWHLACSLFEAGIQKDHVFWICKHSANNKFATDNRYNATKDLLNLINKAEQKVKVKPVDVRAAIDKIRNTAAPNIPGGALAKRRQILFALKFAMETTGKFQKVIAGLPYFIPNDTGRPIPLTPGSEHYRALLHLKYGFNSADPEYKSVHDGIIDEAISIQKEIQESTLSYYTGQDLYLHTGRRDVLHITADGVSTTANSECGILFPWHDIFEPFTPNMASTIDDWGQVLWGDLHNTTNMHPAHARALLKSWFIFSLFRSQIVTRPILAFFGPPGSTKSTLPHRLYTLLYSNRLAVSGVSGAADFDSACSRLPIYCVDNLDSYVSWIIDKLALAIGNSDILKRKLWTDVEVIRQRRQAMLVVTAHNPKFTREDVTSRLLLITLDEVKKDALRSETDMITEIARHRADIWGAIIKDVVKVLKTPRLYTSTVKWRIQDFAQIGEWIGEALGHRDDFNAGLAALLTTQSETIIGQEELLSQALIQISREDHPAMTGNELWNLLLMIVGTNQQSFIHTYKNSIRLQQKLTTIKPALAHILDIESEIDMTTKIKRWRIVSK